MVRNKEKYELATQYRKRGFSYTEIASMVGVSKSTVSAWFSSEAFSKKVTQENSARAARESTVRLKLINKARHKERQKSYEIALKTAVTEYKHYKKDPLFIAGLMLYVGEGDIAHQRLIRIASSNMEVHRIFIAFAKRYLGLDKEKVHFWLLLYPYLSEQVCVKEWSKALKLKPEQFYKNQFIESRSTKPTLRYGVGNTIIGGTILKQKLMKWVELALKEL